MSSPPGFEPGFPVVQSERCLVGLAGRDLAGPMLEYYERNRSHLEPWEPARPPGFYTETFWQLRLALNVEDARMGMSLRAAVMLASDPGRVVGSINLSNIVRGVFLSCHLGYSFDGELGGQGLATESVGAMVEHAFDGLGLHRVQAAYIPENHRSGRLLERLGFEREGLSREYLFIDGAWRDHVLTAKRAGFPVRPLEA